MGQDNQTINCDQHPDFLWTWKSNKRGSRVSVWLPYFSQAKKIPRSKKWSIAYNGGSIEFDLKETDLIMFYGATGELPLEFLDDASKNGVMILIHRRNVPRPYVFYPSVIGDEEDILTRQIQFRTNERKRLYIAKTLIKKRLENMGSTIPISAPLLRQLSAAKTIDEVRAIEANTTARYWNKWYDNLDIEASRRKDHPINSALDAGSKFLYGVILRWLVFHRFSPNHGFMHQPTSYPSLVYDLMEPFRYVIENVCSAAWKRGEREEKKLVALSLSLLKEELDEPCYVSATRQYVRKKNLLHGAVLALRSYLIGDMRKLVFPSEGVPNGGRPIKASYKLPGSMYDVGRKPPEIKQKDGICFDEVVQGGVRNE